KETTPMSTARERLLEAARQTLLPRRREAIRRYLREQERDTDLSADVPDELPGDNPDANADAAFLAAIQSVAERCLRGRIDPAQAAAKIRKFLQAGLDLRWGDGDASVPQVASERREDWGRSERERPRGGIRKTPYERPPLGAGEGRVPATREEALNW